MTRTSVALGFGVFCGVLIAQITESFLWSLVIGVLVGLSFGIAESMWDEPDEPEKPYRKFP